METSNYPGGGQAFAIWLTGLPASGKSTITAELVKQLADRGIEAAVLESDVWRKILTPNATYSEEERDVFYGSLSAIGKVLVDHGVPVVFDATANRRVYRDRARQVIPRFVEVYVDSPLDVCVQRDPKGIYRRGRADEAGRVPGQQAVYEPPLNPEVVVQGSDRPHDSATRVVGELQKRGLIPGNRS